MRFLRFFVKSSQRARGLLVVAMMGGALAGAASVGLLALINASLRGDRDPSQGGTVLAFVGLCLLATVTRVGSQYFLARLGQGMARQLRLDLSRRILQAPLRRLEELSASRLLATLTDDVNAIVQALVTMPLVCVNGTVVVGCLGYLAWLDSRLFGLLVAVFLVGIVSYQLPARAGIRRFRQAREEQDALFGHFRNLTDGTKELKLHRERRAAFLDLLTETADRLRDLRVRAVLVFGAAAAWGQLLFFAVVGVLLYSQAAFSVADHDTMVAYTLVLLYMMTPLQTLLDGFPNLGRADVAVQKIDRLGLSLEAEDADGDLAAAERGSREWRTIELKGVVHAYQREGEERKFALGPIDWRLEPGELVFLVGGNGSGKTTLAKVLVGLYDPQEGSVWLDGEPVGPEARDDYRQLFSAVFSDFFLFEELLGLEAPDLDDRTRRHLEALRLQHKVTVSDGRLSTLDLSQGQRKRLALLTAYLEDRPVYLFDEWAADQDPVFKELFYRQIVAELRNRGKAVVVISHDDRYFHLADRVLMLEDGRLRFDGRAQDLGEATSRLWQPA